MNVPVFQANIIFVILEVDLPDNYKVDIRPAKRIRGCSVSNKTGVSGAGTMTIQRRLL